MRRTEEIGHWLLNWDESAVAKLCRLEGFPDAAWKQKSGLSLMRCHMSDRTSGDILICRVGSLEHEFSDVCVNV